MDTESSSNTIYEQYKRKEDSFQAVFQSYEPFELNSGQNSPLLSSQLSQSDKSNSDAIKSDVTILSGSTVSPSFSVSGKAPKVRKGATRPNHTPRPPNSFILYRKDKHAEIISQNFTEKILNNNTISRLVADMWRKESDHVKALYASKAEEEKQKHFLKYPNYKYQPRKNGKKTCKSSCVDSDYRQGPLYNLLSQESQSLSVKHGLSLNFEDSFASWATPQNYDFSSDFSFTEAPSPHSFNHFKTMEELMDPNYQF